MKTKAILLATALPVVAAAGDSRPETWFLIIGGNASKAGLTADLEALRDAGFGGIQLFHGQYGKAEAWDGVAEQILLCSGTTASMGMPTVSSLRRTRRGILERQRS